MRSKLKRLIPKKVEILFPLLLVLIVGIVLWRNTTPGTFLTGWDTLHPEFNLTHALTSTIQGVWRGDQGLGAIAGHSHMSELPRLIYLALVHIVLPLNLLRYSFFFLCVSLGPLGAFFLVRHVSPSKNRQVTNLAAFLSASFYLFNLTTVQHFYVPFEMFATQYAALPWLFLTLWLFLKNGQKKSLALFAFVSFLSTPQAYAATLFYAWAIVCTLFLGLHLVLKRGSKSTLKRSIAIGLTILATNAFWMLPNMYSITNQSTEIRESSINQIFSPEAFIHNKAYGDVADVVIGKSFLFHWQEFDFKDNRFVDLLNEWNDYLTRPYVLTALYGFVAMAGMGLIIALIKKDLFAWSTVPGLLITLFFLINENSPTGGLFSFLREHSSLIEEGFRMPFTKFSLIFLLFNTVYISHFFGLILRLYKNNLMVKSIRIALSALIFALLVYTVYPMFTGSLISESMRVTTPSEYFMSFDWFKTHEGRVAQLPLNSMWGWQYNSWGYQGAGFAWFGMSNPFLTRDFDRWSAANETFYIQASTALASNDSKAFDEILKKYQVRYLFYDESIINAGSTDITIDHKPVEKMLQDRYELVATFGFIKIYQTPYGMSDFTAIPTYTATSTSETYSPIALSFQTVDSLQGVSYPFVNTDSRTGITPSYSSGLTIQGQPVPSGEYNLFIPHFVEKEAYLPVSISVSYQKSAVTVRLDLITPEILVNGKVVTQDPVYMKYSLKTLGYEPGYLTLNGQIFDLSDKTKTVIGTAVVPREGNTTLALFGVQAEANTKYGDGIGLRSASFCSSDTHKVPTKKVNLGFEIPVGADSVCLGDGFTVEKDSIVSVSYKTSGPLSPFFCVNQAGVDGCVNKAFPISTGDSEYKNEVVLPIGNYWFAFVAQSQPVESTVSYNTILVRTAPKISSVPIPFGDALNEFVRSALVPVTVNGPVTVSYNVPPLVSEDWNLHRGHTQAYNCDLSSRGEVFKSVLTNGIVYEAHGEGVSCDYFDYRSLAPNEAYLLRLTGTNTVGRSMKVYLTNSQTKRVDIETLLGSGSFDTTHVVLPIGESTKGYVANIETRSFGRVSSKNQLSSLAWYYFPYQWLKDVKLIPVNYSQQGGSIDVKRETTRGFFKTVTVESPTGGVFEANSAYESGWIATTNGKLLPHIKVNGWANGWIVPDGESTVTIVFLPQLLEYIGFVVLLGFGAYLLRKSL